MRGLANQKRGTRIHVLDDANVTCYEGTLEAFPFSEAAILALSIGFFNDPAPCFIHRGAVVSRMMAEIEQALDGGPLVLAGSAYATYFASLPGAACVIRATF